VFAIGLINNAYFLFNVCLIVLQGLSLIEKVIRVEE
jgi:hypothetical protein